MDSMAHDEFVHDDPQAPAADTLQPHIVRYDAVRLLVINGTPVRFTPLEYRLMQRLVARIGSLVLYDTLTHAAFGLPDDAASRAALDKHLDRIRAKLRPVGLAVPGVTKFGCLLLWERGLRLSNG